MTVTDIVSPFCVVLLILLFLFDLNSYCYSYSAKNLFFLVFRKYLGHILRLSLNCNYKTDVPYCATCFLKMTNVYLTPGSLIQTFLTLHDLQFVMKMDKSTGIVHFCEHF